MIDLREKKKMIGMKMQRAPGSRRMGNFMQALWKGFGRKIAVGEWVKGEEGQASSEINLRKKR